MSKTDTFLSICHHLMKFAYSYPVHLCHCKVCGIKPVCGHHLGSSLATQVTLTNTALKVDLTNATDGCALSLGNCKKSCSGASLKIAAHLATISSMMSTRMLRSYRILLNSGSLVSASTRSGRGRALAKSKEQTLAELRDENDWKNDLILFWLPSSFR